MKQIKLGEWPGMALSDAAAKWAKNRDLKAGGSDPVQAKKMHAVMAGTHEFETMRGLLMDFLSGHIDGGRSVASARAARSAIERLLAAEPEFAQCHPKQVTRGMAFKILDDRKGFPAAAKVLRSLLGQATDRALDAGRLDGNVPNWWRLVMHGQLRSAGKVVGGVHIGRSKRVLSEGDLKVLLPWAAGHMPQLHHDITMLYLHTGMRGVEITGLRVEFLSEEADGFWITYPAHLLKMERDRDIVDHRVPACGLALEILRRRIGQARDGWLFWTDRGGVFRPYNQSAYATYIYDIQPNVSYKARRQPDAICPVVKWSPHDLRRTARTLLGSMDCPDEVGEAIIGHKPREMVGTYNLHTYDRQKRLWVARLAEKLGHLLATSQDGLPARPY
jgi:integrase